MTKRIRKLKDMIVHQKLQKKYRKKCPVTFGELYEKSDSPIYRKMKRLCWILDHEETVFLPDSKIVLMRTFYDVPDVFEEKEWEQLMSKHFLHELGHVSNICPDYSRIIETGLVPVLETVRSRQREGRLTKNQKAFLECEEKILKSLLAFCDRYAESLQQAKQTQLAEIFQVQIPYGATSFYGALQFFRLLHFVAWYEGEYHMCIGRFDQYIYPYLQKDLKNCVITNKEAFELLEEFFLTFNIDSDLYPGVQQGDDGQSMMLGGVDRQGNDAYNLLSEWCLKACEELALIDPKINLRVNDSTPMERYITATQLTKIGLGFPQYSNDDIVIPALVNWGYSLEDARDYTVAACWEFIIPGKGMEIPNIGAFSFPKVVNESVRRDLDSCESFEDFLGKLKSRIQEEADRIEESVRNLYLVPAPFLSLMMEGCLEKARDISEGCVYNNYGVHGTGLSCGADSLFALKTYYFEEHRVKLSELLQAVYDDFEDDSPYLKLVREKIPHMGDGEPEVDCWGVWLLDQFAQTLSGKRNERGGIFRPGTGSAMFYIQHAAEINASPDGRRKGEFLPANYSPSLFAKVKGPLSIIQSFTTPDLKKTANGGPLTLEFHNSMFRSETGIEKVASLVKAFIAMGGHQLQLNSVNAKTLRDAQNHPERYQNLIVRVWGWSAYFVELDKIYQDHLIRRAEYVM